MAEVVTALRLTSPRQVRALIDAGLFPPGTRLTAKAPALWWARDVAAFLHLRSRGCRVRRPPAEKPPRKNSGKNSDAP